MQRRNYKRNVTLLAAGARLSRIAGAALICAALLCSPQLALAQFSQQAKLIGTGFIGADEQGFSVALSSDGNTAIVGGPADNGGVGAAWAFDRAVSFLAFNASLQLGESKNPAQDTFALESGFTLASTAPPLNPSGTVMLAVGPYSVTFPANSFKLGPSGTYYFDGAIGGVKLAAALIPTGTLRYAFAAGGLGANLTNTANPVSVSLTIGNDGGNQVSVYAFIVKY
jgi:hypothetical protein